MGEVGEAVGDDDFQVGKQRASPASASRSGPVAALFVDEAVLGEQVFVVGVERRRALRAGDDRRGSRSSCGEGAAVTPWRLSSWKCSSSSSTNDARRAASARNFSCLASSASSITRRKQHAAGERRQSRAAAPADVARTRPARAVEGGDARIEAGGESVLEQLARGRPPRPGRSARAREPGRHRGQPSLQDLPVLADEMVCFTAASGANEEVTCGTLSVNSGRKWRCVNELGRRQTRRRGRQGDKEPVRAAFCDSSVSPRLPHLLVSWPFPAVESLTAKCWLG